MSLRRMHLAAAVAALGLLGGAACKDQGPGSLSDPAAVTTELEAVNSAFEGEGFASYSALAIHIAPAAGGALAQAAIIAEGSTPRIPNDRSYLKGASRTDRWRQLVPHVASLSSGPIIPDSLYGDTYEWDLTTAAYVLTARTGAPTNGVRFILYAVNPLTNEPVDPLNEVGYVDLMDESAGNTVQLHIQVKGASGTPTYLDYTATVIAGTTTFTATVNGSLSNGQAGAAERTLDFTLSFQVNASSVVANSSYNLNNPSVGVDAYERVSVTGNGIQIDVDFRFRRPGEVVRVFGAVALAGSGNTFSVTGDLTVTVNGGIFARLHTDGQNDTWTKHDGSPLTAEELTALQNLFDAMARFFEFVAHLVSPLDQVIA